MVYIDIYDGMILNPSRREGQHGPVGEVRVRVRPSGQCGPEGEGQTLGSTIDPEVRVRP